MAMSSTARLFASSSRRLATSAVHSAETADDKFKDTAVISLSPITTASIFLLFPELHVKGKSRSGPDSSPFGYGIIAKTTSYGFTRMGTTTVATDVRHDADGHPDTTFCVCDWCEGSILILYRTKSLFRVYALCQRTGTTFTDHVLKPVHCLQGTP